MSDRVTLDLVGPDNQRRAGVLEYGPHEGRCRISLELDGQILVAAEADYFEAFCRIREQLEDLGVRPFCYGASRNVYPSGMARDMGVGLKAYRLYLGQRCLGPSVDGVDIFDSGPDVEPATVAEQRDFWERWCRSQGWGAWFMWWLMWFVERFSKNSTDSRPPP